MNTFADQKKVAGILLVRDTFLDIYIPSFSQKIYSLQLPSSVYINMELVNADEFKRQVSDFFAVNALPPLEVCMVIQSPILKKEFSLLPQAQLDSIIQTYLDYIPFDTVLSKRIKSERGVLLVAANGDYIDTIQSTLTQLGCSVTCITPLEGLPFVPQGGVASLSVVLAQAIVKNMYQMKQEAFQVAVQKEIDEFEVVEMPDKPSQPASQLPLLLAVFFILLVVLAVVYINMGKDFGLTPRPVRRKTIVPTPQVTQPPNVKGISTYSMQPAIVVISTPTKLGLGNKVAEMVIELGYNNVRVDTSLASENPKTTLIVPTSLNPNLRSVIIKDIRSLFPDLMERMGSADQDNILLILGN